MHVMGYIVFGAIYNRWIKPLIAKAPFFEAVSFSGYIRPFFYVAIPALSVALAVILIGYIRTVNPIATPRT